VASRVATTDRQGPNFVPFGVASVPDLPPQTRLMGPDDVTFFPWWPGTWVTTTPQPKNPMATPTSTPTSTPAGGSGGAAGAAGAAGGSAGAVFTSELREHLARHGWVVVPGVLTPRECKDFQLDMCEDVFAWTKGTVDLKSPDTWRQWRKFFLMHSMLVQHGGLGRARTYVRGGGCARALAPFVPLGPS
jgi:hypothetical protein